MEKKYIQYFDFLRVFAACSVVFMHVVSQPLADKRFAGNLLILVISLVSIAFTAVPLFFMMSGYLLLTSEKTSNIKVLLKRRLPHLLLPLLFWTCIVAVWDMFQNHQTEPVVFLYSVLSGISTPILQPYWYMYTLAAIYLISPLLYRGISNMTDSEHKYFFGFLIILLLQGMVIILLPGKYKELCSIKVFVELLFLDGHLLTFLLGYYIGKTTKIFKQRFLFILFTIDLVVIVAYTYICAEKNGALVLQMQDQSRGYTIILAACLFLFFKQKKIRFGTITATPFVNASLGIYMIHNILNRFMSYLGWEAITFSQVILKTVMILFISYVIIKTLATIKPLCFISTGVNYSRACETMNWIYTYNKIKNKMDIIIKR